ncbi:MAG TPA: diguanylate cyclase [Acidimicrobiales bacterium]|nr:diguanylate cyclase [Acidimicrobiales bacterium]
MTTPAPARRRPRLRSLLLASMLVPVALLGGLAVVAVGQRWDERSASVDLRDEAGRLQDTLQFVAALSEEQVHSVVHGLHADLDLPASGDDDPADDRRLAEARVQVDALRPVDLRRPLVELLDELGELRAAIDVHQAGYAEVDELFARIDAELDVRWRVQMSAIEAAANEQDLPAGIRARLRTLRDAMEAFTQADDRIRAALGLLVGPGVDDLRALLESSTRFRSALERAAPARGSRADTALQAFRTSPASRRTEALLEGAIELGLGQPPPLDIDDLGAASDALEDGADWALLLGEVVAAAAADLEQSAADEVDAQTRGVAALGSAAAAATVLSLAIVLVIARRIIRPAADLEAAARRIQHGDLELPPLDPQGPRELAATVDAFNDMAATLAAVEQHAVALAEDPDSPVHADPLPGRTGQAMQDALDRLRSSMSAAEQHRAELTELATRDGLTGLLNRTAALDAIERDLARARRDGTALLALYVDLDGLKALNDTYGHAAGDEAIRRTAEALAATTRDADVVARLGGDEFLVVGPVPPDGHPGVGAFAERIHDAVSERVVELDDGSTVHLGCSVGVAVSCAHVRDADSLVRTADVALYRAKESGRGRVVWSTPPECVEQV